MTEQGVDNYGAEFKRTSNDFKFKRLEQDNCVCSICHGTGAKLEFRYITRNYESARVKNRICKDLQAHEHSFCMISDDYKERFKAEYKQLIIRLDRLNKIINEMEEDKLDYKAICSLSVLVAQSKYMDAYASILRYRAQAEGINLD